MSCSALVEFFFKLGCSMFQVKLNPSLADAWLCLGNCIWKKGDLSSAKNCFTLALSKVIADIGFLLMLSTDLPLCFHIIFFTAKFLFSYLLLKDGHNCLIQGPNKKILCQLSMLERRMAQGKAFLPVSETTLRCSQLFLGSLVPVEINKKPRMFSLNFWLSGALYLVKGAR